MLCLPVLKGLLDYSSHTGDWECSCFCSHGLRVCSLLGSLHPIDGEKLVNEWGVEAEVSFSHKDHSPAAQIE